MIIVTLDYLNEQIELLKRAVNRLEAQKEVAAARTATGGVADDHDLDSEWGDPSIKYGLKVKYWKEQPDPNIGFKFSECTPEYLDATAKYYDACAYMKRKDGTPESIKVAGYKDRDAARARGWAARIRARGGASFATKAEEQDALEADALPF